MTDLGYQHVCKLDELDVQPHLYRFRISHSPFIEALSDTGRIEQAHLYCENVFDALASAYLSSKFSATYEGTDERGPIIAIAAGADG
jgi:hypothetical protein